MNNGSADLPVAFWSVVPNGTEPLLALSTHARLPFYPLLFKDDVAHSGNAGLSWGLFEVDPPFVLLYEFDGMKAQCFLDLVSPDESMATELADVCVASAFNKAVYLPRERQLLCLLSSLYQVHRALYPEHLAFHLDNATLNGLDDSKIRAIKWMLNHLQASGPGDFALTMVDEAVVGRVTTLNADLDTDSEDEWADDPEEGALGDDQDDAVDETAAAMANLALPAEPGEDAPPLIALYRGIHYLKNHFTRAQRRTHRLDSHVGQPLFATATQEHARTTGHSQEECGHTVRGMVEQLKVSGQPVTIDKKTWRTPYAAFQELFTNSYSGFHRAMALPPDERLPFLQHFPFTTNPILASSSEPYHAAKYAMGLKSFGTSNVHKLDPEYLRSGRPRRPYLGKVSVLLVPEEEFGQEGFISVVAMHEAKDIAVRHHFSNNILAEKEISTSGYIPGRFVVAEEVVRVPNFERRWTQERQGKYGLSQYQYKKYQWLIFRGRAAECLDELLGKLCEAVANRLLAHAQELAAARGAPLATL